MNHHNPYSFPLFLSLLRRADMVSSAAIPLPSFRPPPVFGHPLSEVFLLRQILPVLPYLHGAPYLHILRPCAFCPAFMIRLATALVMYSAGGNGFISPSLFDLSSFSFPAFPLLLLAEVGIIFRCKDSVQPGAARGLCQWRVCENLPLSGRRFAIKAK